MRLGPMLCGLFKHDKTLSLRSRDPAHNPAFHAAVPRAAPACWPSLTPTCPQFPQVTDVILQMIAKAEQQDQRFLLDLAALQDKHVDAARELLGESKELTYFVSRLMDDINNLKAMLNAMSIGMCCSCIGKVAHGALGRPKSRLCHGYFAHKEGC